MKIAYDKFDAILYRKSGKYPYVSEQDDSCDILMELTGLKASAGVAVLSQDHSAIFVDGRYKLAAKLSVDLSTFEILDYNFAGIFQWIKKNVSVNGTIAYDPRFLCVSDLKKIKIHLPEYKFQPVDLEDILNLHPKRRALKIHRIKRTFHESKLANLYGIIAENDLDAYLLCDPCSISWLLNIRDFDSQFSPVVFGYLLTQKNYESTLYLDNLYSEIINPSECAVQIKPENELVADLQKFSLIGVDESEIPSQLYSQNFQHISNPCISQKAIKNEIEIADIKEAAKVDSAAIVRLMYWIHGSKKASLTEIAIAEKLVELRKQDSNYVCESFPCISAADEHSAIIHYSPTQESNMNLKNILLLDTGGQYKYGTTDITRTICLNVPSAEQKKFYTAVLKGHIAVANAKFPEGISFAQLEPLARQFLWQLSSDYPHSTSHGIGYMSSVHEKLAAEAKGGRVPLQAGMIISNEPGYYKDGNLGIRLENMMLVKDNFNGYLTFETISLVPFDINFIDVKMLTEFEKNWLAEYNEAICKKLKRLIPQDVMLWLESYTRF